MYRSKDLAVTMIYKTLGVGRRTNGPFLAITAADPSLAYWYTRAKIHFS